MMTVHKLHAMALTTASHAEQAVSSIPTGTNQLDLSDCHLASYEGVSYLFNRLSVLGHGMLRYNCNGLAPHVSIIVNVVNSRQSCPVCGSGRTKVNWRSGEMMCLECGAKDGE